MPLTCFRDSDPRATDATLQTLPYRLRYRAICAIRCGEGREEEDGRQFCKERDQWQEKHMNNDVENETYNTLIT